MLRRAPPQGAGFAVLAQGLPFGFFSHAVGAAEPHHPPQLVGLSACWQSWALKF
jgi:hypothetical protein